MRDGRIARYRAFYDVNDLARQLGHRAAAGEPRREGDGRASSASRRGCSTAGLMTEPDFDAVVVGASVAGCTAARLFAQRGARVALVERRPDLDAYKTVCTHYIQPSATPTIERLGLAPLIEEHGAVRNSIDLWTPYGGWIRHRGDAPYGYNVTRQVARSAPAQHDRRDAGRGAAARLHRDRAAGRRRWQSRRRGRGSPRARAGALRGARSSSPPTAATRTSRRMAARARAACARTTASSTGPTGAACEPADDRSRMWFMEPDCAYTFPNEDGLCLILVGAAPRPPARVPRRPRGRLPALHRRAARRPRPQPRHARVQAAGQARRCRTSAARPRGPGWRSWATPRSPPIRSGASAADGPSRARSGSCEETAGALVGGGDLDAALDAYRSVHRRRLGPHHFLISDIASRAPGQPARARDVPQRRRATTRSTARSSRSARAAARPRRCSRRARWRAWCGPEGSVYGSERCRWVASMPTTSTAISAR